MGFKNYRSLLSKYGSLTGTLEGSLKNDSIGQLFTYLQESFFLSWFICYIVCLGFICIFNFFNGVPLIIPSSLDFFLSSYWGASVLIAVSFTLVLKSFLSSSLSINDLLEVTGDTVHIKNTDSFLAVFSCSPPLLHDRNDFSFLMENFQPLSIELHPAQETIFFILYGTQDMTFRNKIKECSNLLNSFFSAVHLLSDGSLKKFLSLGLDIFTDNPYTEQIFFSPSDCRQLNTYQYSSDQTGEDVFTGAKPFVFLLSLVGSQDSNSIEDKTALHFFRGTRIGLEYSSTPTHGFNSPLVSSNISHSFSALVRLPAKHSAHGDASDVNKMYFYVLHKFFQYRFQDLERPVPTESLPEVESTSLSQVHILDNVDNQSIPTSNDKFDAVPFDSSSEVASPDDAIPVEQLDESFQQDLSSSKISHSRELVAKGHFVDLKKISFQFTQFCHLYCPALNDEFRKQTTVMENNFAIPNGCFEHILRSNEQFFDFFKVQHENLDPKLVFQNPAVRENFIEFIQEKEMALIDNICHISSLIILSANNFDIQENAIFSLVQYLEKNFL